MQYKILKCYNLIHQEALFQYFLENLFPNYFTPTFVTTEFLTLLTYIHSHKCKFVLINAI